MTPEEIKSSISKLEREEFWELVKWFEEFQAKVWDKELEEDGVAGRLDFLIEDALRDLKEGHVADL